MSSQTPQQNPAPVHHARLLEQLSVQRLRIRPDLCVTIADLIRDQIARIARELDASSDQTESLWNIAHAAAHMLPTESNCALDALRIAVRKQESLLYRTLPKKPMRDE